MIYLKNSLMSIKQQLITDILNTIVFTICLTSLIRSDFVTDFVNEIKWYILLIY